MKHKLIFASILILVSTICKSQVASLDFEKFLDFYFVKPNPELIKTVSFENYYNSTKSFKKGKKARIREISTYDENGRLIERSFFNGKNNKMWQSYQLTYDKSDKLKSLKINTYSDWLKKHHPLGYPTIIDLLPINDSSFNLVNRVDRYIPDTIYIQLNRYGKIQRQSHHYYFYDNNGNLLRIEYPDGRCLEKNIFNKNNQIVYHWNAGDKTIYEYTDSTENLFRYRETQKDTSKLFLTEFRQYNNEGKLVILKGKSIDYDFKFDYEERYTYNGSLPKSTEYIDLKRKRHSFYTIEYYPNNRVK